LKRILNRLLGRSALRAIMVPRGEDLLARADRARDSRDWTAAARDYAVAIEDGWGDVRLQVQLGHALKELGRYGEAEAAYRRFLEAMPFDTDIHLQLGHLFNKQDDPASALHWYERALQLAPTDVEIAHHADTARRRASRNGVWRKRETAMRLVEAERWGRAQPLLAELVDEDGEDDLIGILANVTKEAGELEAASALYDRYRQFAQAQAPELLPDVELQIGHLRKIRGDYQGALRHYIRAREQSRLQIGHLPDARKYNTEINACVSEIYTCFWMDAS